MVFQPSRSTAAFDRRVLSLLQGKAEPLHYDPRLSFAEETPSSRIVPTDAVFDLTPYERASLYYEIQRRCADLASDPLRDAVDCAIAATLDALAAMPGGMAHLLSLVAPFDEGMVEVHLVSREGHDLSIIISAPDTEHGSRVMGHPTLLLLERALAVANTNVNGADAYAGVSTTELPFVVMTQLGLFDQTLESSEAIGFAWSRGDNVTVGRAPPAALNRFGLQAFHTYTVAGAFEDSRIGEALLVLHDPWAAVQPSPIPASMLGTFFPCAATEPEPPPTVRMSNVLPWPERQ
jgi:hypothetical protein